MQPIIDKKILIPKRIRYKTINHALKELGISQGMRRRLRHEGIVHVNNQQVEWNHLLVDGDHIQIVLTTEQSFEPYDLPLDIIYEDAYLLCINKPRGLLMHPTASERKYTLANALIAYYIQSEQPWHFHPIHRLDKDTSGLVLIAKSALVQHAFSKAIGKMQKSYYALVEGSFAPKEAHIHLPIQRKEGSIMERCVSPKGVHAYTELHCKYKNEKWSLLDIRLHTGRTHQIRVHCAAIGHPLLGDDLYGGSLEFIKKQALHAYKLTFTHPFTDKEITIQVPIPEDMQQILVTSSSYLTKN